MGAARFFDHLVLSVPDLDQAAQKFARMGFLVGEVNRHPWGSKNRLIWVGASYIELIQADRDMHAIDANEPLFRFLQPVLEMSEKGGGPIFLALSAKDAKADSESFSAKGVGQGDFFHFERDHSDDRGNRQRIGFDLAFTLLRGETGPLFCCQRIDPEGIMKGVVEHPNGVKDWIGSSFIADNPADFANYFSQVSGQSDLRVNSMGIFLECGAGGLEVLTVEAYRFQTGMNVQASKGLLALASITLKVDACHQFFDLASRSGYTPRWHGDTCVLGGDNFYGLTICATE